MHVCHARSCVQQPGNLGLAHPVPAPPVSACAGATTPGHHTHHAGLHSRLGNSVAIQQACVQVSKVDECQLLPPCCCGAFPLTDDPPKVMSKATIMHQQRELR